MPKRGQTQPWRLKTTWTHADIRPFVETFSREEDAIRARYNRMRVDNVRGDANSLFEITHRERPDYVEPPMPRCPQCELWGTDYNPFKGPLLCTDHAAEAWEEYRWAESND